MESETSEDISFTEINDVNNEQVNSSENQLLQLTSEAVNSTFLPLPSNESISPVQRAMDNLLQLPNFLEPPVIPEIERPLLENPDHSYLKSIVENFISHIEKNNNVKLSTFAKETILYIDLENKNKSFKIYKITLKRKRLASFNTLHRMILHYTVKHLEQDFLYTLPKEEKTLYKLFEKLLEVLWKACICKECLIITDNGTCHNCLASKSVLEYGIAKNYTQHFPVCTICFDSVFNSHFECNHYFHKSCILEYASKNSDAALKCPNCRIPLTKTDKINFYLE